jgi:hypothetical protein
VAPEVGNDVVYLKGGGLIRGSLVEAIPNDHATVQLASGQSAVIPWDRVDRIDRGGAAAPGFYAPPAVVPMAMLGPKANVHVDADQAVVLERREGRTWVYQCSAPCDADVPLSGSYRFTGTGVRPTSAFRLNAQPGGHVFLQVSTAAQSNFTTGIALTGVGGGALIVGGLILYMVAIFDWTDGNLGYGHPSDDGTWNTAGLVLVAGGAAALVVGVVLLGGNLHSKVEQAEATPGGVQRPRNDAWLRLPTWHDDKAAQGLPKAVGVPLFEKAF